ATEAVFAAAREVSTPEGTIRVPAPHHMLLLTASHAARDLFLGGTVQAMLDAAQLLARAKAAIDWDAFDAAAGAGRSRRPVRAFLALLARLGVDMQGVPGAWLQPPSGPSGAEFERLARAALALYPDEPTG